MYEFLQFTLDLISSFVNFLNGLEVFNGIYLSDILIGIAFFNIMISVFVFSARSLSSGSGNMPKDNGM